MRRSPKLRPALSKPLLSEQICWLSFLVRLHLLPLRNQKKRKRRLRKQELLKGKPKLLLRRHLLRSLLLKKQPLKSSLLKKRKKKINLDFSSRIKQEGLPDTGKPSCHFKTDVDNIPRKALRFIVH